MAKRASSGLSTHAVMAQRHEAIDSLDFFPTPPWATRAFFEDVLFKREKDQATGLPLIKFRPLFGGGELQRGDGPVQSLSVWDPAAGEGHMTEVQKEYISRVHASDVHDYGRGYDLGSYVGEGADVAKRRGGVDIIATNPPFNLAVEFVERALTEATKIVAMLLRTVWVEGKDRYQRIFLPCAPDIIAQYSERVPMTKGCWDPDASTATAYAWFIWITDPKLRTIPRIPGVSSTIWIPYGAEARYTRLDDRARFGKPKPPRPEQTYADMYEGDLFAPAPMPMM